MAPRHCSITRPSGQTWATKAQRSDSSFHFPLSARLQCDATFSSGTRIAEEVQRELNDTFKFNSDDDNDEGQDLSERPPLTHSYLPPRSDLHHHPPLDGAAFPEPLPATPQTGTSVPGGYNFERDYDSFDYPLPGSPPSPSALALPNDIGNSNGLLPTPPVRIVQPVPRRSRVWWRTVDVLLPQHYLRRPRAGGGAWALRHCA